LGAEFLKGPPVSRSAGRSGTQGAGSVKDIGNKKFTDIGNTF